MSNISFKLIKLCLCCVFGGAALGTGVTVFIFHGSPLTVIICFLVAGIAGFIAAI